MIAPTPPRHSVARPRAAALAVLITASLAAALSAEEVTEQAAPGPAAANPAARDPELAAAVPAGPGASGAPESPDADVESGAGAPAPGTERGAGGDPATEGSEQGGAAPPPPDPWKALMAARRAAWAGRPDAAVDAYEDLLEREPSHVRALVEMGNVLYRLRRWRDAGETYGEAALRLIDLGNASAAIRLLPLVARLSPRVAGDVEGRLEEIGLRPRR